MRQETFKAHINELRDCIAYIESLIRRHCTYDEITKSIGIKYYGTYGSLRNVFSRYLKCPMHRYVRRRILTETYFMFRDEKPIITKRGEYRGVKSFRVKFEKEFGLTADDDHTIEALQAPIDVENLFEKDP